MDFPHLFGALDDDLAHSAERVSLSSFKRLSTDGIAIADADDLALSLEVKKQQMVCCRHQSAFVIRDLDCDK